MTISVILAAAILTVCLVGCNTILRLFFGMVEDDVMEAAQIYFLITACSYPFLAIYDTGTALYRVMGKTRITMYVALAMNTLNIVGDFIGVFVFQAGVVGVAVPTLVSRMFAAVIMTVLACGKQNDIRLERQHVFVWDRDMIRRILKIAVPSGVENGLFALGKVLVTSIVAGFGTLQIAANGVANSIDQIAVMVVNANNLAIIPVVGRCIGSKDDMQAQQYTKKLMKVSYVFTAVLSVVIVALLPVLLRLYNLSADTLHLAATLIILHNLMAVILHPTSFNLANSLRAAGDAKFTMEVGISSMIVFRLGSAVLFGKILHLGVLGVWIAMGLDWLARSVAFVWRYKLGKWRNINTI